MALLTRTNIFNKSKVVQIVFNRCYGKLGVLGIPFGKGQRKKGVKDGPKVIRGTGFINELKGLGVEVKDFGDVSYVLPEDLCNPDAVGNMIKLAHVAACHEQTSQRVASILCEGYKCMCLGGDHSIAIGTIDGHIQAKQDVAVLWVDAHADINTAATSASGNVHGMPAALLVKELADYWPYLPGMDWLVPKLSVKNLAYIGLRDVDAYERFILEKFNIAAYGMDDIERYGVRDVTAMALKRIDPHHKRSIHVSFDIDSLDPQEAPSTGTPVRGGLSLREGIQIIEDVVRTRRLNCIDFVEVNPSLGDERDVKVTLESTKHLIKSAFGHSRRGFVLKDISDIPVPETKE